ncbi:MAG TPA: HAMP domain-containing sensor histidine kinase [Kofleriaceae bacterium]|nr:HAMP domain-containing sensor histidine kinase [Kofleriaceae bacterium]
MSSSPAPSGGRIKEPQTLVAEATSLLAHDLNNQLALLLANHEFLDESLREIEGLDPEIVDTLSITQASLQHMMALVRNITDIARMEDPGVRATPVATDVTRLVRGVMREHRPLHDRGAVQIQVDCPDVLRAEIDPLLLKRITHNMVANARRFVDKGGKVRVSVLVSDAEATAGASAGRPGGLVLVLSVANSGPGIPPERRDNLFEKYRVSADGRVSRGMGLYFCRLACEAHGGTLALSEDADFTTIFTARLPAGHRAA